MSLSRAPQPLSSPAAQIWPVAVIIIIVVLRAPADVLPATISAMAGIVALLLGERHSAATGSPHRD